MTPPTRAKHTLEEYLFFYDLLEQGFSPADALKQMYSDAREKAEDDLNDFRAKRTEAHGAEDATVAGEEEDTPKIKETIEKTREAIKKLQASIEADKKRLEGLKKIQQEARGMLPETKADRGRLIEEVNLLRRKVQEGSGPTRSQEAVGGVSERLSNRLSNRESNSTYDDYKQREKDMEIERQRRQTERALEKANQGPTFESTDVLGRLEELKKD